MEEKQFINLDVGDIVKGKTSDNVYVVIANYGNRCTAVSTADLTNPKEWELVRKAKHEKP